LRQILHSFIAATLAELTSAYWSATRLPTTRSSSG